MNRLEWNLVITKVKKIKIIKLMIFGTSRYIKCSLTTLTIFSWGKFHVLLSRHVTCSLSKLFCIHSWFSPKCSIAVAHSKPLWLATLLIIPQKSTVILIKIVFIPSSVCVHCEHPEKWRNLAVFDTQIRWIELIGFDSLRNNKKKS